MTRRIIVPILVLMGAASLAGCSKAPQQRYQAAVEVLEQAREARIEAAQVVAAREQALADLKQKLAQARGRLNNARAELQQARARIDKVVNDAVLFRAIQRTMLNSERFSGAAISVGVDNRVVTLTGTVRDKVTEKAALEAARNHPGVRKVRDQLTVTKETEQASSPTT